MLMWKGGGAGKATHPTNLNIGKRVHFFWPPNASTVGRNCIGLKRCTFRSKTKHFGGPPPSSKILTTGLSTFWAQWGYSFFFFRGARGGGLKFQLPPDSKTRDEPNLLSIFKPNFVFYPPTNKLDNKFNHFFCNRSLFLKLNHFFKKYIGSIVKPEGQKGYRSQRHLCVTSFPLSNTRGCGTQAGYCYIRL